MWRSVQVSVKGASGVFGYQWLRCNASGTSCGDLAGATAQSYTVTSSDAGGALVVLKLPQRVGPVAAKHEHRLVRGVPRAGLEEIASRLKRPTRCSVDCAPMAKRLRPMPIVLGHEAAGVVEETGPGITDLKRGDHVALVFMPQCGHCLPVGAASSET